MIADFEIIESRYCLKIPVAELGKEIEITIRELEKDYEYQKNGLICATVDYVYNDTQWQFGESVSPKGKCLLELVEEILYWTVRRNPGNEDCLDGLPSTCGFFYRHTFRKLRPWIREHAKFFFDIQVKTEDGSVIRAKYRSDGWWGTAEIYCGEDLLGSLRMGRGDGGKDFSDELARIESYYLSRQRITEKMEIALKDGPWPWGKEEAAADQKVLAVYYHDYCYERPDGTESFRKTRFWYYMVKGERHSGGWRLLGLICRRTWKWGEIFVGEMGEEQFLPYLPDEALRMPEIFGQRLEDVLRENGEPGWEELVRGQNTEDIWKATNSVNPEWRREAKERLGYLAGEGLAGRAERWFGQGSLSVCIQNTDKVQGIFHCENILDVLKAAEQCEKEYGVCVYYVMAMPVFSHVLLTMLCVGGNQEEWEYERQELKKQLPTAITCCLDDKEGQKGWETGVVRVKIVDGGMIRVS